MPRRLITIFLAFAACGAISRFLFVADSWQGRLAFPIPFGLLAGFLAARSHWPVFTVLAIAVWNASYDAAVSLTSSGDWIAFALAGMIGGTGLALAASVSSPRLRKPDSLVQCGVVGAVAGWSFLLDQFFRENISGPFAVWQGVVGTLLYWLSVTRRDARRTF